jgi:hypothetical protein
MFNIDDASKKSKEAMDTMLKNYSEVTKGFQAIAAEATDYSKKSFQDLSSFMEAMTSVKSVEAVFELQASFMKSSYESFVAEATKMSEMYAELGKVAFKPYEATLGKAMVPMSAAA